MLFHPEMVSDGMAPLGNEENDMMNRGILAIAGFIAILIGPAMEAYAGPLDRMRDTNCGVSGCQSSSIQEVEQKKSMRLQEARDKRLTELYPRSDPLPATPPTTILKFDKTDPLYQLLMRTLIEESEARKDAATGVGKTGP